MNKTVLKDIGLYKNKILSTILSSEDFCRAMLIDKEYTEENVDDLIYTQIFPYMYIDETQTEVLPYACFEVKIPYIPNGSIKKMQIVFWVCAHKKCMQYHTKDYIGTRIDILSDAVERALHDSKEFGIGKLNLTSVGYVFPNSNYCVRELVFDVSDFKVKES